MSIQSLNKKIKFKMVGRDGNAYFLMGAFSAQAQKEKWTKEEIEFVMNEAMSGDYNNLLRTLMKYSK